MPTLLLCTGYTHVLRVKNMSQTKFGVSVSSDICEELDELVEECADLRTNRSEVIEVVLNAYLTTDADRIKKTRELLRNHRTSP